MATSRDILESARARYAETKRAAEMNISEHMLRSSRLLKQVRSVTDGNHYRFPQTQMSYIHSLQGIQTTLSDVDMPSGRLYPGDRFQTSCGMDTSSGTSLSTSHSSTGSTGTTTLCSSTWSHSVIGRKQMTQAAWISQSSTVHTNLSKISNWEDHVKIPEILLTDPADILCGNKSAYSKDESEEKDKLSQLLNDTSYEIALEADVTNSYRNRAMFSQHVASSLGYCKGDTSHGALCGVTSNHALVDSIVGETCAGLENLSHEWNAARGAGVRLSGPQNGPLPSFKDSCDDQTLSSIDTLYMKTFGVRSGLLGDDNNHNLTHALLQINEKDKAREAELAPKMCTTRPPVKDSTAPKELPSATKKADFNTSPLSTEHSGPMNPFDHVNILSEDKFRIKLHKMSDFNKHFTPASRSRGTDVDIQTDMEPESQKESLDPLKRESKIKVVYAGRNEQLAGLGTRPQVIQHSATEIASDASAAAIISNVMPRLVEVPTATVDSTTTEWEEPNDIRTRRAQHRAELAIMDDAEQHKWKSRHAPLYERMRQNERCGVRMSMLCRGGRRGGSRLTHGSPRDVDTTSEHSMEEPNLIYESPSNKIHNLANEAKPTVVDPGLSDSPRMVRGYYGYDDEPGIHHISSSQFFAPSKPEVVIPNKPAVSAGWRDPFQDFEGWWNQHSVPLSRLREQLSIS
ncbi:hypothetical protein BaOVIS_016610 [Babesia ovis]|uniref:Uncharacterized protein n=1 Tax=Babesia ovis TaxID=5869 RepID=A0A9W5TD59_BABOV|nr:hypothetical protein BaOVIS_016610 [Babesia ovis]